MRGLWFEFDLTINSNYLPLMCPYHCVHSLPSAAPYTTAVYFSAVMLVYI